MPTPDGGVEAFLKKFRPRQKFGPWSVQTARQARTEKVHTINAF
jgi:hypothetical protein